MQVRVGIGVRVPCHGASRRGDVIVRPPLWVVDGGVGMTAPIMFFADPNALTPVRQGAQTGDPEALKEAARQFESLFTQMLLKSMREANKSFGGDSLFGSDQSEFYQDLFDQQMALHLSRGKGLGLADMLIRQLSGAAASGEGASSPDRSAGAALQSDAVTGNERRAFHVHSLRPSLDRAPGASASSAISSRHQPVSTSKVEFVRKLLPHAQAAARELGVDVRAILAQAALETGWGRFVPCGSNGECSYNFFGIKATGNWSGATVTVPTLEFEDGLPVRKAERFRAYGSAAESFRDFAALIRNSPRYRAALGRGEDIAGFAAALQNGGYATDPEYANKIVSVARELGKLLAGGRTEQAASATVRREGGLT